jgi:hypothetical protein
LLSKLLEANRYISYWLFKRSPQQLQLITFIFFSLGDLPYHGLLISSQQLWHRKTASTSLFAPIVRNPARSACASCRLVTV